MSVAKAAEQAALELANALNDTGFDDDDRRCIQETIDALLVLHAQEFMNGRVCDKADVQRKRQTFELRMAALTKLRQCLAQPLAPLRELGKKLAEKQLAQAAQLCSSPILPVLPPVHHAQDPVHRTSPNPSSFLMQRSTQGTPPARLVYQGAAQEAAGYHRPQSLGLADTQLDYSVSEEEGEGEEEEEEEEEDARPVGEDKEEEDNDEENGPLAPLYESPVLKIGGLTTPPRHPTAGQ